MHLISKFLEYPNTTEKERKKYVTLASARAKFRIYKFDGFRRMTGLCKKAINVTTFPNTVMTT